VEQAFDLGAARAALAHQRQVEDLARQVAEVHGARQAAQLRDAQSGIAGALAGHQAHRQLRTPHQLGEQVGILPVEIDQDDAPGRRRRGLRD